MEKEKEKNMSNNYTAENIKTLDYFQHIRQYPGMYIGSKDLHGLHHCAKEVISNSIDEYLNGAGNRIEIKLLADGGIYIGDNGRGIPLKSGDQGVTPLQACFGVANTGGKFDNATGESGYNSSGGQHGTGGKAVNALSTKLLVATTREGTTEIVEFSRGEFISRKYIKAPKTESGVEVKFYPDPEIFETIVFDSEKLQLMIQEFSFLCTGLTFNFVDEKLNIVKDFKSDNGLVDYLTFLNKKKDFIANPIYFYEREGSFQVEVALGYNEGYSNLVKLYTNNIPQEKGTHLTGFKTAFTQAFNAFAREKKWLKEKDSNLTGSDLEEGQVLIINFKMVDAVFKGQNKEELSSSEGRTYVQRISSEALKAWFQCNEKDMKVIAEKAINARKARDAAKKARENARGKAEKKNKILNLPTKLVDAWSKDRASCELFITEGDSAASGLIEARDGEYQAIFPVRGKIISVLKQKKDKVFANQEVVNIIKALGLDLDKNGKLIYDVKKLRYGKIMLAADGDADGQAIKNLLLTLFWWLCPELIINGHVCATIPPLFRITTKKNEYVYLRDGAELEQYKQAHAGEKFTISRNKGLGEQDSDELEACLLNVKTRNAVQITVENAQEADNLFNVLMGSAVPARRAYLLEHSEEANND